MNTTKHFTKNEILAYADDLLPQTEQIEISRHLMECGPCRKLLPEPSIEQLKSAIMTEWIFEQPRVIEPETYSFSASFFTKLYANQGIVFGCAAVILFLLISIIFLGNKSATSDVVVRSVETGITKDQILVKKEQIPITNDRESTPEAVKVIDSAPKKLKETRKPLKLKPDAALQTKGKPHPLENKSKIVPTRGTSGDCVNDQSFETEISSVQKSIVFRWKKVPKAVKYQIYISDDEEVLIDEFETARENTYLLKKPLDPVKTYKWKIIITLENGQTIVGDAQKFTVKDLRSESESLKSKKKSRPRCAERN